MIGEFCAIGARVAKPILLENFGYARCNPDSVHVYAMWPHPLARDATCVAWIVWRLLSRQNNERYPADEHDQLDFPNHESPIWNVLKAAATRSAGARRGPQIQSHLLNDGANQ